VERHLPVLSNQTDDPDYGDAYKYLEFLSKRNDRFHLTFEHNPSRVTRSELEECYSSAAALMMEGTGDAHF
jgi:16S rRNA G527 N7-methylase RsmG